MPSGKNCDGDHSHGWKILATQPHGRGKEGTHHTDKTVEVKREGQGERK